MREEKQEDEGKQDDRRSLLERIRELEILNSELRDSREQLQALFEHAPDAYYLYDLKGTFVDGNAAAETLIGYDRETLIGKNLLRLNLLSPRDLPRAAAALAENIAGQSTGPDEFMLTRKDGTQVHVEIRTHPVKIGGRTLILGLARDITERKLTKKALKTGEERYRLLFENMMNGFALHEIITGEEGKPVDYVYLEVNSAFEQLTGLRKADLIGNKVTEVLPGIENDPADWIGKYGKVALTGKEARFEQYSEPLGKWFSVLAFSPQTGQFATVFEDITKRKLAQAELRTEKEFTDAALDAQLDTFFLFEPSVGRALRWNQAFRNNSGYTDDEIAKLPAPAAYYSPEDLARAAAFIEEVLVEGSGTMALELVCKDGSKIPTEYRVSVVKDVHGEPRYMIAIGRDLTDRKQAEKERLALEAQLRQSQRLESIGTLASGVAHEVNNPLTGIINYAELIKDRVQDDERATDYAEAIIEEGNRIAGIVRNLLSFARQDETERSLARIVDIVNDSLSLLRASLRMNQIELVVEVPEDLPEVKCRSQQIQQVVVNLITNAQASLNERYPEYDENKILSISAAVREVDGRWLRVSVEDHGTGIPEELQLRVFDPFFTSKSRDQGTGLGLAVSHGIVAEHGGTIRLESHEGEYTRFHVDLPLPAESSGNP